MAHTYLAAGIIRYDSKRGRCGNLLGLITFTDGKSLKVWDPELHEQCLALARTPASAIRYELKHSAKWGDALTMIVSAKAEHERYDDARGQDEQVGTYAKAGSWLGHRVSKAVQRHIDDDRGAD